MAQKDKEPRKPPKPATEEYKILQELKALHETMKLILKELERNL